MRGFLLPPPSLLHPSMAAIFQVCSSTYAGYMADDQRPPVFTDLLEPEKKCWWWFCSCLQVLLWMMAGMFQEGRQIPDVQDVGLATYRSVLIKVVFNPGRIRHLQAGPTTSRCAHQDHSKHVSVDLVHMRIQDGGGSRPLQTGM